MTTDNENRSKVLIVDDISQNIQVAASILQKDGYQMAFAQDGTTAVSQANTKQFDLILLDIMMPQMDGFEVCRQIRANPDNQEIPIIFLTAKNDADSVAKGFELGAMDYLVKPFNGTELRARVKTHLDLYHSKNELVATNDRLNMEIAERIKIEEALERSREKYRNLAIHDSLTGLYNTRYLYSNMETLIAKSLEQDLPFSLMFLDIDNFKRVVDTHGHLNGSRALAEVAKTLMLCIEEPAYGVAYGGDEFVVVLPGADHECAKQKAFEVRAKMLETVYLAEATDGVSLQASFGIATYPDDAKDIKAMLATADKAMFHVKAQGKNGVADTRNLIQPMA